MCMNFQPSIIPTRPSPNERRFWLACFRGQMCPAFPTAFWMFLLGCHVGVHLSQLHCHLPPSKPALLSASPLLAGLQDADPETAAFLTASSGWPGDTDMNGLRVSGKRVHPISASRHLCHLGRTTECTFHPPATANFATDHCLKSLARCSVIGSRHLPQSKQISGEMGQRLGGSQGWVQGTS